MTNQPDAMETKTSNPRQQGELRLSASARTPLHLLRCQVHGECRRPTEEEERNRFLEILNEVEQILDDNAGLYNPSSAGGLQQPSE
jgi:hypothetical protein